MACAGAMAGRILLGRAAGPHQDRGEREGDQHLLISFKGYPTEEEAKIAFQNEYLILIHLASDIRYYQKYSYLANILRDP